LQHLLTGRENDVFKHELVISGIPASVRKTRGGDISAACGLLASGLI
jgi:adenine C2-methylase RlmN of 23S rRNA A2503 and tRNA A37